MKQVQNPNKKNLKKKRFKKPRIPKTPKPSLQQSGMLIPSRDRRQSQQEEFILNHMQVQNPTRSKYIIKTTITTQTAKQKPISQQREQPIQCATEYYAAVGIIRASWRNRKGEILVINYGTAFAVSPQLLLTCQHNIFFEKYHCYATDILFIPGVENQIDGATHQYRSKQKEYFKTKEIIRYLETFTIKPLANELCLIALNEPLEIEHYLKIGSFQLQQNQEVQIIGYPSELYSKKIDVLSIEPQRTHLKGKLVQAVDCILSYNIDTKVGHSGSPILALNKSKQVVVIGIHSHRGQDQHTNCGLFFNKQIQTLLKEYQKHLKDEHKILDKIGYRLDNQQAQIGCSLVFKQQWNLEQKNAVKESQVSAVKQSEVSAVKQSDVSAVKESEVSAVKQSEVSAVKESELSAVKESEVSGVKQSEVSAVKQIELSAVKKRQSAMDSVYRSDNTCSKMQILAQNFISQYRNNISTAGQNILSNLEIDHP